MAIPDAGIDLRKYSGQVTEEIDRRQAEIVMKCVERESDVVGLYGQLNSAISSLSKLESILESFRSDLGSISSEITEIQRESLSMVASLDKRKSLQRKLAEYLEEVRLNPAVAEAIHSAPINAQYCVYIAQLREKLLYFRSTRWEKDGSLPLSMLEILPELKMLSQKAAHRIKSFFLSTIQTLTRQSANFQQIQDEMLLRHKDLVRFLRDCDQFAYGELCASYLEAVNGVYLTYFRSYASSMKRLAKEVKRELVVEEESRGLFSAGGKMGKTAQCFEIGERCKILEQLSTLPGVITTTTLRLGEKYDLERLYHSLLRLLADSYSFSYFFVLDFFAVNSDQFHGIFKDFYRPVLDSVVETVGKLVGESWDIYSLPIMVKITDFFRGMMAERRIQGLETVFERLKSTLWLRFQTLLDANIRSLDQGKVRVTDISPHHVTSRFCQLANGLSAIRLSDDMYRQRVNQLNKSFISMLENASLQLRDLKNRSVFLLNNLDLVLEMYSKEGSDSGFFETVFRTTEAQFIELQLSEVFGALLDFLDAKNSKRPVESHHVELIQADLKANWRKGVALIQSIESDLFTSATCQRELLRETFTRLVIRYTEYCEVLKKEYPALLREAVPVQVLMQEVQSRGS